MLIRFSVENFRSFHERATLSMFAAEQEAREDRENLNLQPTLLRQALVYGANASGKSNLIKAMAFARDLIVTGTRPKQRIPVTPFLLNSETPQQPSRFEFEFVVDGFPYAYGFVVDNQKVHEEWLYQILDKVNELPIFERGGTKDVTPIQILFASKERWGLITESTRPNQLLLSNAINFNLTVLMHVYRWFAEQLVIIFPETKITFDAFVRHDERFRDALTQFLKTMDTGIEQVITDTVPQSRIAKSTNELAEIIEDVDETTAKIFEAADGKRYTAMLTAQGDVEFSLLSLLRTRDDSTLVRFNVADESDGTQRLFDLFMIVYAKNRVFVVDEIERSLHPNLVRRFLELFDKEQKTQLIATTHEATLLDPKLMGRDQIWFVEKSAAGGSTLYSLYDFDLNPELDVRRGYLHGRFGAVPILGRSLPFLGEQDAA